MAFEVPADLEKEMDERIVNLLEKVGMKADDMEKYAYEFSGGQRQRIAIARALIANPRILIFDEATSALDYESERIIQDNMREICKGRSVLIVAHRLSAVRDAHRIVVMERGQIVEVGSHAELLKIPDGIYAHLYRLQSEPQALPVMQTAAI